MDNKKKIEVIFSLFIGAIFISSYAVLSSLQTNPSTSSNQNTATTGPVAQTIYLNSYTNAVIENYTGVANLFLTCKNPTYNFTSTNVSTTLTKLEGNNSVSTFYSTQNVFSIDLGSYTPITLYDNLKATLPSNEINCIGMNAGARLSMPTYVNFTLSSTAGNKPQVFPILLPNATRTIYLNVSIPSNSVLVPVEVSVLVYKNGTVYQTSITKSGS